MVIQFKISTFFLKRKTNKLNETSTKVTTKTSNEKSNNLVKTIPKAFNIKQKRKKC